MQDANQQNHILVDDTPAIIVESSARKEQEPLEDEQELYHDMP